jgi:hypothetical protein
MFLERLEIHTTIPLNTIVTEVIFKIMFELLSVLALALKQLKQGRFSEYAITSILSMTHCAIERFAEKLLGKSEIETVLQILDQLTQEGALAVAQTLGTEDGTPSTGKEPWRMTSFQPGRGKRGRGQIRGRGGITLIQRLEHAARSPTPEYDEDEDFGAITSTPPLIPPPALHVFFGGGAEADDEPEPYYQDYQDEESGVEAAVDPPQSNRGSLDGLDPAFANVFRRSSSSLLPYTRSPLRQAVHGLVANVETVTEGAPYLHNRSRISEYLFD